MLTQTGKCHGRQFDARFEVDRIGEVIEIDCGTLYFAACKHLPVRARFRHRRKKGDGPTAVGDLDRLSGLDAAEEFAGPLPQLAHAHRSHVLTVAHDQPS